MEVTNFKMTEDHLKLLKRMYVYWDSNMAGAPAVDVVRPYGNSDVERDIAEILGWDFDEEKGLSVTQEQEAERLHRETKTALQIALCTQSFVCGVYEKGDIYDDMSWRLKV